MKLKSRDGEIERERYKDGRTPYDERLASARQAIEQYTTHGLHSVLGELERFRQKRCFSAELCTPEK
jgi:hypothetical protein